jgi:hypothetical protein
MDPFDLPNPGTPLPTHLSPPRYLYVGEPDGCHVYPLGRMFKTTSDRLWALVSTVVRGHRPCFSHDAPPVVMTRLL